MVLVVGGNETAPSNVMLKYYSAAAITIGNIYMANIMGSMANYVSVISRRDTQFENKLDVANTIMHGINVSSDTQDRVREYFFSTRMNFERQSEMVQFLELISPSLKQKIALVIFLEPLTMNILVKGIHKQNMMLNKIKTMKTVIGGGSQIPVNAAFNLADLSQAGNSP